MCVIFRNIVLFLALIGLISCGELPQSSVLPTASLPLPQNSDDGLTISSVQQGSVTLEVGSNIWETNEELVFVSSDRRDSFTEETEFNISDMCDHNEIPVCDEYGEYRICRLAKADNLAAVQIQAEYLGYVHVLSLKTKSCAVNSVIEQQVQKIDVVLEEELFSETDRSEESNDSEPEGVVETVVQKLDINTKDVYFKRFETAINDEGSLLNKRIQLRFDEPVDNGSDEDLDGLQTLDLDRLSIRKIRRLSK